jgi:hypothetical protein
VRINLAILCNLPPNVLAKGFNINREYARVPNAIEVLFYGSAKLESGRHMYEAHGDVARGTIEAAVTL